MKSVYLVCFRGTGFTEKYDAEDPLIRAGHVGWFFEDETDIIFGFHPTQAAIKDIGGEDAALNHLKIQRQALEGAIQDDTSIFEHAKQLAQAGERTQVFQIEIAMTDEEFNRIREQTYIWYNSGKVWLYAFPENVEGAYNCATFPENFGLPVPHIAIKGKIEDYLRAMETYPSRKVWRSES